jgi:hypothetical protein
MITYDANSMGLGRRTLFGQRPSPTMQPTMAGLKTPEIIIEKCMSFNASCWLVQGEAFGT